MEQAEMIALVDRHLKAESGGDVEGAVAVYTDDIVHDAVGSRQPAGRQGVGSGVLRLPDSELPHGGGKAAAPVLRRRNHDP